MRRVRVRKLYDDFEQTYMRRPFKARWKVVAKDNPLVRLWRTLKKPATEIVHMPSERRQLKKRWMLYRMLDSNRMLVRRAK